MDRVWLPEDPALRVGLTVSVAAHVGLLLWALIGGIFFAHDPLPATLSTEVSLISSADFAALQARAPTAPKESQPKPSAPAASQTPPPRPKAAEELPPPEETADAAPEAPETPPTDAPLTEAPPLPTEAPSPDQMIDVPLTDNPDAAPKSSTTVAPTPTETPAPDAAVDTVVTEQTSDQPSELPPEPKKTDAAAPADAGQVLETEANREDKTIGGAPMTSAVPPPRPKKAPQATADAAPAADKAQDQKPADKPAEADAALAVDDALAEALSGAESDVPSAGTGDAPTGPPMTSGEKDAFRVAVKECWNVGALSTDALRTVVTVSMTMAPDGKPTNIRLLGSEGATGSSETQAFDAARRAIMRCTKGGYALPADKYEQWKEIEITFDPTKMALR